MKNETIVDLSKNQSATDKNIKKVGIKTFKIINESLDKAFANNSKNCHYKWIETTYQLL